MSNYSPTYRCLVIIPTYNEAENIVNIIYSVLAQGDHFSVLIVDDNSPDDTAGLVEDTMKHFPFERVLLLRREGKLGLGTAYIEGFKFGVKYNYDFIFEMDADFSHDPKALNALLAPCIAGKADMTVGSRYIPGGEIKNWPADRVMLSKGASLYVRMITWMPIKDPTAGFICYSNKVLASIDLDKIKFLGYAFQIEMKYAAYLCGFRIKEVPITFIDRIKGASKMSANIISEALIGVFKLRFARSKKDYYLKNLK